MKKTFNLSSAEADRQIRGIEAYLQERAMPVEELPELPREALRQLIAVRKNASVEEALAIQDTLLSNLHRQYGNFDEANLVLFLVKYLLQSPAP